MVDNNNTPSFASRAGEDVKIEDVQFKPHILMKLVKKMKPKLSSGPDGYPPYLLKQVLSCFTFANVICLFYQSFLSIGIVPSEWKEAIIAPLFKKGASSNVSNYRPISLTSVFSKLMETCIVEELLKISIGKPYD